MGEDTLIESYPWLSWNLFDTLFNTSHTRIMRKIKNNKICANYNGWLVVKESRKKHYIINAKSLNTIRLPPVNFRYTTCLLTRSPRKRNLRCYVLFMAEDTIFYCRPGDKRYERYELEEGMHIKSDSLVAVFEGKVYYNIDHSFLVVIEWNESILQVSKIETFGLRIEGSLVQSGCELLLVQESFCDLSPVEETYEIDCFKVFRFDFLNNLWIKVDNIGEFAIFLPRKQYGGISLRAVEPRIKKNCIYFLQLEDEDIHVYDLENHSFMLHSNRFEMETLHFREESNNYDKQNAKFLPQMPCDVSNLILGRIFTVDTGALANIRSTCKDWSSIVWPPASYIDLRYNRYPYLVTLINGKCNFFHSIYDHSFCLDTPELVDARIMFCKFGWLLLSRFDIVKGLPKYFFFNPFTKQKKFLPDYVVEFATMSFSSPPTSSEGFVVGVERCGTTLVRFKYGESEWKVLMSLHYENRVVNYAPVIRKQKCYCIRADKRLIGVDLNTGYMSTAYYTLPKLPLVNECYLVEDKEGFLFVVFMVTGRKVPYLMRMINFSSKYISAKLENKMVYVSSAATCLISAPTSTGNKIYFPFFRNSSNIFYSLSTRKYYSYSENYSNGIPFGMQRMINCAWIDVE